MPASTSSSTLSPSTAFSPSMAPSPSTTPTTTEVFQIPTAVLPTFNYTEASSVSLLTSTASSLVPAYVSRMEATATSTIVGATAAAFVIAVLVLGGVGVAIVLSNRRQKRLRRQATRMRLLSGRPSNDPRYCMHRSITSFISSFMHAPSFNISKAILVNFSQPLIHTVS